MGSEKKEFGKWWLWVLALIILTVVVMGGVRACGLIGGTIVERKMFENSYQKHEADKAAHTTYQAQLALLRGKLNNPNLDEGTRAEIQAQIDAINIMKSTKDD